MVPSTGRPVVPARYTFNRVLYHHGTSASGVLDVLRPNAMRAVEAWLRIEEEIVKTVRYEQVFWR